jgi:protein-disulfide isomerase
MGGIRKIVFGISSLILLGPSLSASSDSPAYSVNGKTFTVLEATKKDQGAFFEIEKKKYDRFSEMAREEYLDQHWAELSKKKNKSVDKTREAYFKDNIKISDKEVSEILEKFKEQLSKLSSDEQKKQVREYLTSREMQKIEQGFIEEGLKSGKLQILYPKPQEPVYDLKIGKEEPVRYGPKATDVKPIACKGDDCPITVIEYSEYQCPFCDRMLPDTTKVLEEYKGKIRWYVRDFPLDFHPRALPAAFAAKCAHFQGKYWEMYYSIFEKQKDLSDEALIKHAEKLSLNMKTFNECYKTPKNPKKESAWKKADDMIRENMESGRKYGVQGTPAFFINGKKLSGALPFAEFKRVIDEDLANQAASKKKS